MWTLAFLFCLLGTCAITEGYVELRSFDLDLENNGLTLYFSDAVDVGTFDHSSLKLIDNDDIPIERFSLSGGSAAVGVNATIVEVALLTADVNALVELPGLCISPASCYLLYGSSTVRGQDGLTTLPGRSEVNGFVPYPLELQLFSLDLDNGHLTLSFNKNVSASTVVPASLTLHGNADTATGPAHTVLAAECDGAVLCADGPAVTTVLSQDDLNTLKYQRTLCTSQANCFLAFTTDLVADLGGFPVKERTTTLQVSEILPDTTPPRLVGVGLEFSGNDTVYLHFNEAVDPATFSVGGAGQLLLSNQPSNDFVLDLGTAGGLYSNGSQNISTVVVLAAASSLDDLEREVLRNRLSATVMAIAGGVVSDYSGLPCEVGSEVPLYRYGGEEALTQMTDYPFVFDMQSRSFRVTFPCDVPEYFSGSSFVLLNSEPSLASQRRPMLDEYYGGFQNDMVFYLTDNATKEILNMPDVGTSTSDTFVLVSESFCEEGGALLVQASSVVMATNTLELVTFTVDMSDSNLVLTFNTLLGTVADPSQISLQKESDSDAFSFTFPADTDFTIDGWLMYVELTESTRSQLSSKGIAQNIATSFVTVTSSVTEGLYGNAVNEVLSIDALVASRYIGRSDPVPTTIGSFSFHCDRGTLQLNFSQLVYTATLDLTRATLVDGQGRRFTLYNSEPPIEYTDSVGVVLDGDVIAALRATPGLLVHPDHVYLEVRPNLVYDINDLLLDVGEGVRLNATMATACICPPGYETNATSVEDCSDVNECDVDSPCDHSCNNTVGSFVCSCDEGYLLHDDGLRCIDVDECLTTDVLTCNQTCVNDAGSFHCECNSTEYVLLSDSTSCAVIDHCNITAHGCNHMCVDDFGLFRCLCREGYRLMADQMTCTDIDECEESTSGCQQLCGNQEPSYNCSCNSGYELGNDSHSCNDVDECARGSHSCQSYCTNHVGNYSCYCDAGFTLREDGLACQADSCFSNLTAPEYGSMACSGEPVTRASCNFTCQPGFTFSGSATRTCQPDHSWSGEPVQCTRMTCPPLSFFDSVTDDNCIYDYEAVCTLTCLPAYFNPLPSNNSMSCVVQPGGVVGWTDRPICQEREPCLPSPCLHGAPCSEIQTESGGERECDCSGTGYMGPLCEVGVVTVPSLPLLTVGTVHTVAMTAYPDSELTVTLSTDVPVDPAVAVFNATTTRVEVSFAPSTAGIFTLEYVLGGENGFVFTAPTAASVIVQSDTRPDLDRILAPSCCGNASVSTHACSNGQSFSFRSTCRQNPASWPEDARVLQGVSFTSGGGLSLPLALRSVTMATSGRRRLSYSLSPYGGAASCDSCEERPEGEEVVAGTCGEQSYDCSCFSSGADAISTFIRQESLAATFLGAIAPLLPPWLRVEPVDSARTQYSEDALSVVLVDAEELVAMDDCRGFYQLRRLDFSTYSVLRYSGRLAVTVGGVRTEYTPPAGQLVCVAVSLCEGGSSPVLMSFPPGFPSLNLAERMLSQSWQTEDLYGLVVNIRAAITDLASQPDVALYGKLRYSTALEGGTRVDYIVDGLVGLEADLEVALGSPSTSPTKAVLFGRTQLLLNASGQVLHLQELSTLSKLSFNVSTEEEPSGAMSTEEMQLPSGDNNTECDGLGQLHLTLSQWSASEPGNVFNKLLSNGDSPNCPVAVKIVMGMTGGIDDVILTTSCHTLSSGNLAFPGLDHSLHLLHESSRLRCTGAVPIPATATGGHLLMVSRFQATETLSPTWFLEFMGVAGAVAVTTLIDPSSASFVGRTTPSMTTLQLFGDPQNAEVLITDEHVQFQTDIQILGSQSAVVATATATDPGATPTLVVAGELEEGDFQQQLEDAANLFVSQEAGRGPALRQLLEESLNASRSLSLQVQALVNHSREYKMAAEAAYQAARVIRQARDIALAEASNDLALERGRYTSSELTAALDSLCQLEEVCTRDSAPALHCSACPDLPLGGRRYRYGNTTCNRTVTEPTTTRELVDRYRLTPTDGPEVSELLCGGSTGSSSNAAELWRDPERGCRAVTRVEGRRHLWTRSSTEEDVVRYGRRLDSRPCRGRLSEDYASTLDHLCCAAGLDTTVVSPACLAGNLGCALARARVYQSPVGAALPAYRDLLLRADQAVLNRSEALLWEGRRMEELRAAERRFGHLSRFRLYLSDLQDLRQARLQLQLAPQQGNASNGTGGGGGEEEVAVTISSVSFNLTLLSRPANVIPLKIDYLTTLCPQGQVSFDFLVASTESSIVDAGILLARTAVGGACPQEAAGASDYDLYCSNLLEMRSWVGLLGDSLRTVLLSHNTSLAAVEELITHFNAQADTVSSWGPPEEWANSTAGGHAEFGGLALDQFSHYLEYRNLVGDMGRAAQDSAELVHRYIFIRWMLSMETQIGTAYPLYGCFGLADCLLRVGGVTERLLRNAKTDWSAELLTDLTSAVDDLKRIVQDDAIRSVAELSSRLNKMETVLSSMIDRDFWCEPIQDVLLSGSEGPVSLGHSNRSVTFTCASTSLYTSHYQWLKNDVAIPGATGKSLTVSVTSVAAGGVYSCSVQSHRGDEVASYTELVVYAPPTIQRQPQNFTASVLSGPVFFRCNATGSPAPTWRWFWQKEGEGAELANGTSGSNVTTGNVTTGNGTSGEGAEPLVELANRTTSELMVFPSQATAGQYWCQAENSQGSARSTTAGRLTVPLATISSSVHPGWVEFAGLVGGGGGGGARRKRSAVPLLDPLSRNLTTLFVHLLHSNASSVTVQDGRIVVTLNTTMLTFNVVSGQLDLQNGSQNAAELLQMIRVLNEEFNIVVNDLNMNLANNSLINYSSLGIQYSRILSSAVDTNTVISSCPVGQQLQRDNNIFCVSCEAGSFQTTTSDPLSSTVTLRYPSCQACPLGQAQPLSGQTSCRPCAPGSHQPGLGSTECLPCPAGQFQERQGQFVCVACRLGTGVDWEGAVSQDNCTCTQDCDPSVSPVILAWISGVVIGAFVAIGVMVVVVVIILCLMRKNRKEAYHLRPGQTGVTEEEEICCIAHKHAEDGGGGEPRYGDIILKPGGTAPPSNPWYPDDKNVTMETTFSEDQKIQQDAVVISFLEEDKVSLKGEEDQGSSSHASLRDSSSHNLGGPSPSRSLTPLTEGRPKDVDF